MKPLLLLFCVLLGVSAATVAPAQSLDYEQLILLDAETLAETGIKEAYARVLPSLKKYGLQPGPIEELINNDAPTYAVRAGGKRYEIYSAKSLEAQSWGNATFALFSIVNRQLANHSHKFYAFNSGNDLGGMFLSEAQYQAAIRSIKRKSDWPYIPTQVRPWYGQPH